MTQASSHWDESIPSHENIIYACFGGLSNTGITAALASLEAVKELGLDKACIGCLAGVSTGVPPVLGKTRVAKKVITVDGCPMECSRKVIEQAGFPIAKSIVLVRDIGMKKKALHEDIGKDLKPVMEYISEDDVRKAKELIINELNKK
ncbi:putative zinc-binding protein [Candidatus Bathyarchaeota archaeon]|nr:putative zinc-binding protein [Candidatus Bathyarchaeota archaeon]